jgi:hypothetical protein
MLNSKALAASVSAAPAVYVEDVFSTFLYTGNDSTQTITNGIDLSGKGGLVWMKMRDNALAYNHNLYDTARGALKYLESNTGDAEDSAISGYGLTGFNSNGFTLGSNYNNENRSGSSNVSWTFRKQPKFFDVVTFSTTPGVNTINHSLGVTPGMMIIKRLDTYDWYVWHRSISSNALSLNSTDPTSSFSAQYVWGDGTSVIQPTSTQFTAYNGSPTTNKTFVAYLFAHNAGGFGTAGTDNVVSCGSVVGSSSAEVYLGWEPQWILVKNASSVQDWWLVDNMRGLSSPPSASRLNANLTNAETTGFPIGPTATGFQTSNLLSGGQTYIYIAIRRGPMKTPTVGTSVFSANTSSGSAGTAITTGFPVDMQISTQRTESISLACGAVNDRMRGVSSTDTQTILQLLTHSTNAEGTSGTGSRDWSNTGFDMPSYPSTLSTVFWNFRRAPGFFDVVAYTGTGSTGNTISHNLAVAPELAIFKGRAGTVGSSNWSVFHSFTGSNYKKQFLNVTDATTTFAYTDNGGIAASPTTTGVTVDNVASVNNGSTTYIAYLFATLSGVSKVGSYTGTGTTLQINCGFTAGARFVMIKRTDSTGSWYVWDTARGIVSGNDSYLLLNSTAAEVTNTDYIDPLASGFEISSTAPAEINANGGSYIFLAIA